MRDRVARLSDLPLTLEAVDTDYRVEVSISALADTWQAAVSMTDAQARTLRARTVQGRTPSCGSIDVATAVVIATMLDSTRAELGPVSPRKRSAPSADGGSLHFGAFVIASPELIPKAWLGGGLALEIGAAIPLAFSASIQAPREQVDARGRGASLWAFHAGLALCPAAVRSDLFDLQICAGPEAGAVLASGVGLNQQAITLVPLACVHAGPKLSFKVTRTFALQLSASAAWVFVRPKISWDIQGEPRHVLMGSRIALLAQIGITISPW